MDTFSEYNQIRMISEDKDKTIFITDRGLFYYRIMPFSLKNAGATYQHLVNKIFKNQIEKNIEVYMDDILVKSRTSQTHIDDLEETFTTLQKY